jgi:6-phosphofructokinase 1
MFGHPIVRGVGESLVRTVEDTLGLPARAEKPGTLQRSSQAMLSPVDVAEAREAGNHAVRLALDGQGGRMVTIQRVSDEPYRSVMSSVEIGKIANQQRLLPRDYLDESGTGITDAFRKYALPLLGPDPFPDFARL